MVSGECGLKIDRCSQQNITIPMNRVRNHCGATSRSLDFLGTVNHLLMKAKGSLKHAP